MLVPVAEPREHAGEGVIVMHQRPHIAILLGLVLVALVQAPPSAQTVATDVPRIQFEKYTLPNGLEIILSQNRRVPSVAVNLWYHVGPANEDPGRTGFAHLFEHMMFQGSKHVPADAHFKLLEGAGASEINGTTDFVRTRTCKPPSSKTSGASSGSSTRPTTPAWRSSATSRSPRPRRSSRNTSER